MTFPIAPLPGFNWMAVSWGAPNQVRTDKCSYCDTPLDDDEVPLILLRDGGWCAEFCRKCQQQWWGVWNDADE